MAIEPRSIRDIIKDEQRYQRLVLMNPQVHSKDSAVEL